MQIQSHLGLPAVSPYVPAQAVSAPTSAGPVPPPPPSPTNSLDVLAAAAVAATPPAAPQLVQAEDTFHRLLTEEVALPPLPFQSTLHCGQWHTWLGGELVKEVIFIL